MDDTNGMLDAVIEHRESMEPIATDVVADVKHLPGVRAIVFDVYGTLVVSGSGDVGSADEKDTGQMMGEAFAAVGWFPPVLEVPEYGKRLRVAIEQSNESRRGADCPKPEVDIVDAWRLMLSDVGLVDFANDTRRVVQLACEYEARANPTWPMPGAVDLLQRLTQSKRPLGIVSNAQVFTVPLVEDLCGESLVESGFDLDLCVFSNRYRQAKPGPRLFDVLRDGLRRRGISPHEAVYVGNDMLNDVWAASQAGLQTAWFAGDRRSCRDRQDDPRCRSLRPDVVLTDLMQLLNCLAIE
ncbi:MAG: HAD family hydrolase [Pirellulaceae bacterium]|nr:HAD family hydrolase [Pirellulaceae bacterium]